MPRMGAEFAESRAVSDLLQLLANAQSTNGKMESRRESLLALLPQSAEADDPRALLTRIIEHARIAGGGGKKAWESEDVFETVKNQLTRVRADAKKLLERLDQDPGDCQLATQLGLAAARLTETIGRRFDRMKHELGMLDFGDLLTHTRDLLRETPRVRRRAASGIHFLMVDEFQDTDPVQAEIVRQLCGDELLTGKLFLVGDAKQSIYRFRSADPRVFHALRDEVPVEGRLPLSTNFRSQPEILNFVNCLFRGAMGTDYEPLIPFHDKQLSPAPTIEFLFPSPDPEFPDANSERRRKQEADWIARRISTFLDGTPRVRGKNPATEAGELRPAIPGDIVILFRALSDVGLYEDALRKHGHDYYLVGGRAFYAQQEIFDLVNLCSFLDDPDDEIALVGVLRSPFFSLSDDALFAMVEESETLGNALCDEPPDHLDLEQQRQIRHAGEVLSELRSLKDRIPMAKLLERALERTGFDASLLNEFLGSRKLANLRKLVDMARQMDSVGLFTLKDFVIRLRESVAEQTNEELAATHPESSNVVRLMTVHQSKGLEFPVVILADCDRSQRGVQATVEYHSQLGPLLPLPPVRGARPTNLGQVMHQLDEAPEEKAETDRLLYVATTRAADYLVISACLPETRKVSSQWLRLIASRFDLETGDPAVDPYLGRLSLGEVSREAIPKIFVHRKAPDIPKAAKKPRSRDLPLIEFHDAVEAATASALPETLKRLAPDDAHVRDVSVSRIVAVEAQLRASETHGVDRSEQETDSIDPMSDPEVLGTLVHAVLERIDLAAPGNVVTLVERCLPIVSPAAADLLRTRAIRQVESFLESDVRDRIAEAVVCHRELEFLLKHDCQASNEDAITLVGTIDCLYQTPDSQWRLIDYKTGAALARKSDDAVVAQYELQLLLYALAATEILGAPPASAELVLVSDTVRSVPVDVAPPRLAAARRRIDAAVAAIRSVARATRGATRE